MEDKMHGNLENDLNTYWDSIRNRNSDHSFPAIAGWIRKMHKTVSRSRLEKRARRRRRTRWLVLAILPVLFILSCTIRIRRVESSGSLVNFSIDKKEDKSFQKLSSIQQLFTFTCYEFLQADQPALAFFIFFIPYKDQEKLSLITGQLKTLNGLQKLDISSIDHTVRESLFSTFWHETLHLGEQQTLKGKELTSKIQATLKEKELGFLSISALDGQDGSIAFTTARQNPDSLTLINKSTPPVEIKNSQSDNVRNIPASVSKLQIFNWLQGSWRVKYVPQPTFHHWRRINDSLLMCFIIKYPDEDLIKIGDDGPDVSVGFSIRYSRSDSAILALRGIEWKFLSANEKEIHFRNEITPKSANVKWILGNENKTWQSAISGERNLEVVNLVREEDIKLENIVKEFITKHPELIK